MRQRLQSSSTVLTRLDVVRPAMSQVDHPLPPSRVACIFFGVRWTPQVAQPCTCFIYVPLPSTIEKEGGGRQLDRTRGKCSNCFPEPTPCRGATEKTCGLPWAKEKCKKKKNHIRMEREKKAPPTPVGHTRAKR